MNFYERLMKNEKNNIMSNEIQKKVNESHFKKERKIKVINFKQSKNCESESEI